MSSSTPQKAGLCWFKPEDWERLLEVATDKDSLEDTWQEWEAKSLEMIEVFATRGIEIEKVQVDLEQLIAWCEAKNKPLNASTRAEYVTEIMLQNKNKTLH